MIKDRKKRGEKKEKKKKRGEKNRNKKGQKQRERTTKVIKDSEIRQRKGNKEAREKEQKSKR